jgi:hypothetical protein
MAAKKMFPAGEADRALSKAYDQVNLTISFRILAGQIVTQFSDHVEWVRMSSAGARKRAAMLIEQANQEDRLRSEGKSRDARSRL